MKSTEFEIGKKYTSSYYLLATSYVELCDGGDIYLTSKEFGQQLIYPTKEQFELDIWKEVV